MEPGDLVGNYRLTERLAQGGMGEVWKAEHPTLDRQVAIKLVRAEARDDPNAREAFQREVRNLSLLRGPQILQIADFGFTADGAPFMVTELLEGEDLRARLRREGPVPMREAVDIGIEVLRALSEAHALGIVHRDLKPGNVFLQRLPSVAGEQVVVKVLDFGVAKLVDADGQDVEQTLWPHAPVKGSPRYMAPEQVSGSAGISPATDLYAFAGLLYRVLTGLPVFEGDRDALFKAHAEASPIPLRERMPGAGFPAALDDLLMHCLAKAPGDRPASADEVRERLEAVRLALPTIEPADSKLPTMHEASGASAWLLDPDPEVGSPAGVAPPPPDPDFSPLGRFETEADAPSLGDSSGLELAIDPAERRALSAPPKPTSAPPAAAAWLDQGPAPEAPEVSSARRSSPPVPLATLGVVGVVLLLGVVWMSFSGDETTPDGAAVTSAPVDAGARSADWGQRVRKVEVHGDAGLVFEAEPKPPETVLVTVGPEPARFRRADNDKVICKRARRCRLAIDIDYIVDAPGLRPKRISGDDLFDRRGGRMRVILQPR